jgi:hypothetical protein
MDENESYHWKQRVYQENSELGVRLEKLLAFNCSSVFRTLPPIEQYRLQQQFKAMLDYQAILNERMVNDFK